MPTNITRAQLIDKLKAVKGTTFLTISAFVNARVVKKDRITKAPNPYPEVMKLSQANGSVNSDYEASVNRQLAREGHGQLHFTAKDRAWGERHGALIEKDGKWYLSFHVKSARKPVYLAKTPDGLKHIPKEAVEPYLPPERDEGWAQGVERAVVVRNYAIEGLASVTMNGEIFRIRDHALPAAKRQHGARHSHDLNEPRSQVPGGYEPPETGCR